MPYGLWYSLYARIKTAITLQGEREGHRKKIRKRAHYSQAALEVAPDGLELFPKQRRENRGARSATIASKVRGSESGLDNISLANAKAMRLPKNGTV